MPAHSFSSEAGSFKYVVVGAGFLGSVIAERIANVLDEQVLVIDRRDHVGGNCYSETHPETGIEYHKYGTHIFHTSNKEVWEYINRFTEFNSYRHQVLTTYQDKVYQMPINLETINSFFNVSLKPYEVDDFLAEKVENSKPSDGFQDNFEDYAISLVGKELYEAFIKGYSQKQWHKPPKEMPSSVLKRLPFRKSYDESYYFSRWQGIPLHGYTSIFQKLLDHPNISLGLGVDFFEIKELIPKNSVVIYSGPLDRLGKYKFGKLDWRSLTFEKEVKHVEDYQGTSVMNYAEAGVPFTRIHEPRHLHPERSYRDKKTLIIREYSRLSEQNDEYYPVNDLTNQQKVEQYKELLSGETDLIIGGRLGDFKYYDMHETIDRALALFETEIMARYERDRQS